MAVSEYGPKDAAKDTNSSRRDVSRAWHEARNDAAKEGGWDVPANRHGEGGGILSAIVRFFTGGK